MGAFQAADAATCQTACLSISACQASVLMLDGSCRLRAAPLSGPRSTIGAGGPADVAFQACLKAVLPLSVASVGLGSGR